MRTGLVVTLAMLTLCGAARAQDAPLPGTKGFIAWWSTNHPGERAPPGYHYETGNYTTIEPNDACWREEMLSDGTLQLVNASVGRPDGAPGRASGLSEMFSPDLGALSGWGIRPKFGGASAISCHATLKLETGGSIGGMLTFYDPGQYAPVQIAWVSDRALAARIAQSDGLRTARHLYVTLDLVTPAIQDCVGKDAAKGRSEEFPGQLWARCQAAAPGAEQ